MNNGRKNTSLIYGDMYHQDRYVRERFKIYKDLLSKYIKKGTKILDIGGYTGDLLIILPKGIDYTVVDIDKEALKIARKKGAKTINLDLERKPLPVNEKFDVIVATEILEHLKDPEKVILQIKKILKKQGVVLVSLPNECTLYHRLKVLLGKGINGTGFAPHYHLHFPTLAQSEEFLRRHFKILKKEYWFHKDPGGLVGRLFNFFPDFLLGALVKFSPSLFARGGIYLSAQEL